MIEIDGSFGEGGGQILRSSLSLSLITQTPFRITNIRANRRKPGLMRQHLTAVKAAARVGNARVEGAELGSSEVVFEPDAVQPGRYEFAVGTAGSTVLVMQTVLPPLLTCDQTSQVAVEGGTHNMKAPIYEFLDRTFRPQMARLGAEAQFRLEQHGFYPAGGGRLSAAVTAPLDRSKRLELMERGEVREVRAIAVLAHLPEHIAERELDTLEELLGRPVTRTIEQVEASRSPGNALVVEVESEALTETFTVIGTKGLPAEQVAQRAAKAVEAYLAGGAPVGPYLADQLLVPMAVCGGGRFRAGEATLHTRTQLELIPRFVDVELRLEEDGSAVVIYVEK